MLHNSKIKGRFYRKEALILASFKMSEFKCNLPFHHHFIYISFPLTVQNFTDLCTHTHYKWRLLSNSFIFNSI